MDVSCHTRKSDHCAAADKTPADGRISGEPADWEERYFDGDPPLSNACQEGFKPETPTSIPMPDSSKISPGDETVAPPASAAAPAGAVSGRVRDGPWAPGTNRARAPAAAPAGPPASYAAATLQPPGAVRRGQPGEALSRVSSGRADVTGVGLDDASKEGTEADPQPGLVGPVRGPPPGFVHRGAGHDTPPLDGAPRSVPEPLLDPMTSQRIPASMTHGAPQGSDTSRVAASDPERPDPAVLHVTRSAQLDPEISFKPKGPSSTAILARDHQPLSATDQPFEFSRGAFARGAPARDREGGFQRAVGVQGPNRIPSPVTAGVARPMVSAAGMPLDALPGLSLAALAPSPAPYSIEVWFQNLA
jgi:hypothetical protein